MMAGPSQPLSSIERQIAGSKHLRRHAVRAAKIARPEVNREVTISEEDHDLRRRIKNELEGYINRPKPGKAELLEILWQQINEEYYKKLMNPDHVVNIQLDKPPYPIGFKITFLDLMWAWAEFGQDTPVGALPSLNLNHFLINDEDTKTLYHRSLFMIDTFWNILEKIRGYNGWQNRVLQVEKDSTITMPVLFHNLVEFGKFHRTIMGINMAFDDYETDEVFIPETDFPCVVKLRNWLKKHHTDHAFALSTKDGNDIMANHPDFVNCSLLDHGCGSVHKLNKPLGQCSRRHEKGTKIRANRAEDKPPANAGSKVVKLAKLMENYGLQSINWKASLS